MSEELWLSEKTIIKYQHGSAERGVVMSTFCRDCGKEQGAIFGCGCGTSAACEAIRAESDAVENFVRDVSIFLDEIPPDLGRGSLNGMKAQLQQKCRDFFLPNVLSMTGEETMNEGTQLELTGNSSVENRPPADALVMDDLPNVAGRLHTSNLEFERRCRVYMQAEGERVNTDMALYAILCDAVRIVRELSPVALDRYGHSALYGCHQLHTVRQIDRAGGFDGCVPMPILPKSLIGKTVKVTIEECP